MEPAPTEGSSAAPDVPPGTPNGHEGVAEGNETRAADGGVRESRTPNSVPGAEPALIVSNGAPIIAQTESPGLFGRSGYPAEESFSTGTTFLSNGPFSPSGPFAENGPEIETGAFGSIGPFTPTGPFAETPAGSEQGLPNGAYAPGLGLQSNGTSGAASPNGTSTQEPAPPSGPPVAVQPPPPTQGPAIDVTPPTSAPISDQPPPPTGAPVDLQTYERPATQVYVPPPAPTVRPSLCHRRRQALAPSSRSSRRRRLEPQFKCLRQPLLSLKWPAPSSPSHRSYKALSLLLRHLRQPQLFLSHLLLAHLRLALLLLPHLLL